MRFHPFADYLPMLPGPELSELAADIKEHGLREPIVLFEKKILDGRNRFMACKKAGVKPRYRELGEEDPLLYILSMNVSRRHLTASQKAIAVAKLVAANSGWKPSVGRKEIGPGGPISTQEVANLAGVSLNTAKRARKVVTEAPEKADDIAAGKKTVREAVKEINTRNGVVSDTMGYPVPEQALPYWNRSEEVKEIMKQISKLYVWANEMRQRKDPLYCEINMNEAYIDLGNLYTAIKCALPYAVCTACEGKQTDTCMLCKGRGVISQFRYERAVPSEIRALREKSIQEIANK